MARVRLAVRLAVRATGFRAAGRGRGYAKRALGIVGRCAGGDSPAACGRGFLVVLASNVAGPWSGRCARASPQQRGGGCSAGGERAGRGRAAGAGKDGGRRTEFSQGWADGRGGRHDELIIITAGKLNMRVWDLDLANRKVPPPPGGGLAGAVAGAGRLVSRAVQACERALPPTAIRMQLDKDAVRKWAQGRPDRGAWEEGAERRP